MATLAVFFSGGPGVQLLGIHQGFIRLSENGFRFAIFSSMTGVRADLPNGLVTTSPTGPPPPPPVPLAVSVTGPATVKSGATCTWFANTSGGAGGYQYAWKVNASPVGGNQSDLTYKNTGTTFTIAITVTDVAGALKSAMKTVTVTASAPACQV